MAASMSAAIIIRAAIWAFVVVYVVGEITPIIAMSLKCPLP